MSNYTIPAISRANEILSLVSQQKATFAQIAEAMDMPRSSVYTILKSLEDVGFLRKLADNKTYVLGFRLLELGALAEAQIDLKQAAEPVMNELMNAENLTCHLGTLDDKGAFYLLKKQPANALLVNSWVGKRASMSTSAIGKALLAFLSEDKKQQYIQIQLETSPEKEYAEKKLSKELALTRSRGWAIDNREDSPLVRCVAAPVYDATGNVVASLSLTGSDMELPDERIEHLSEVIIEAAAKISSNLGAEASST